MSCKINLLGEFELLSPSSSPLKISSKNGQAILAMLALARGEPVTRDRLMATFWPSRSEQQARNSLRQTLSTLKKIFKNNKLDLLKVSHTQVSLKQESLEIDALIIPEPVQGLPSKRLEKLLNLFRGVFLENLAGRENEMQQWLESHRRYFQNQQMAIMQQLITHYFNHGEFDKVIKLGKDVLALDPLHEKTHRMLMRAYSAKGDRVAGLKQFQICTQTLETDLSIAPSAKTKKLYNTLLASAEQCDQPDPDPAQNQCALNLSHKPAIAVLPIKSITASAEQASFCDGLTETIISNLSRFRDLLVIASNSSSVYKDNALKLNDIAQQLGVQFVLEGSVQKFSDKLRISVRLIDAFTGVHLWTESYNRQPDDMFKVQDEVSEKIVGTLACVYGGRLRKAWQKTQRVTRSPDPQAFDYFMQGIDFAYSFTKLDNQRARLNFEKAVKADPGFARAYSGLACTYLLEAVEGWNNNYDASLNKSLELATKAIECDDNDSWSYWQYAVYYIYTMQHEQALIEFKKAIDLNPNDADVLIDVGYFYSYCGLPDSGLQYAQKAMRLNPHYPEYYLLQMAQIYFDAHRYQDAVTTFNKVVRTKTTIANLYLAASQAALGNQPEAGRAIDQAMLLDQHASIDKWTQFKLAPYKNPKDLDHFGRHLALAGLK